MHLPHDSKRAYDDTRGTLTAFALLPNPSFILSAAPIRHDVSDLQFALVEVKRLK